MSEPDEGPSAESRIKALLNALGEEIDADGIEDADLERQLLDMLGELLSWRARWDELSDTEREVAGWAETSFKETLRMIRQHNDEMDERREDEL